jgi:hypothetical protein
VDGAVLPGAVRLRAQDQPVADRDRAAALSAGIRSDPGFAAIKAALAELSLDNFALLVSDNLYVFSYLRSLIVAVVSTSILLVIGYPIAYGMARLPKSWQGVAMVLVIVPFWTSFLIRIYAWINILQHDGLLTRSCWRYIWSARPLVLAFHRQRDVYRHRLFLSAVHDPAALTPTLAKMEPGAGGGGRDLGAPPCRCSGSSPSRCRCPARCRRAAVLHSHRRRIRPSRTFWPAPIR